jgi:hypothetical protein
MSVTVLFHPTAPFAFMVSFQPAGTDDRTA